MKGREKIRTSIVSITFKKPLTADCRGEKAVDVSATMRKTGRRVEGWEFRPSVPRLRTQRRPLNAPKCENPQPVEVGDDIVDKQSTDEVVGTKDKIDLIQIGHLR